MPNTKTTEWDKSGCEFSVHLVEGRKYPDYENSVNGDYGIILKKVKELEMRSDDILAVGFPKSGNNWIFEVIQMILTQRAEYTELQRRNFTLDSATVETLELWKDTPSPRFFLSHFHMDSLPQQIPIGKPWILYIVRNVKDMAVSLYKFVSTLKKFIPYKGEWEDYLDLLLEGQFVYDSWFDHVKQAEDFMRNHPDVPFHVVCYEKLKINPVEEIRKMCHFLNKPDHLAEAIAHKADFDQMSAGTKKFEKFNRESFETESSKFLRKGIVGDWRNHFTEEQYRRFDKVFEEKLQGYSIGDMLRPYMGL